MDCDLQNIVGLTQSPCDCFDDDKPNDFDAINASDSGYFITDNADGFPLQEAVYQALSCGDGNIYDVLQRIRNAGIKDTKNAIGSSIAFRYEGFAGFKGAIGRIHSNGVVNNVKDVCGIQIAPRNIRDASMTLKAITLGMSVTNGAIDVTISCSAGSSVFTPQVVSCTSVAGEFTRNVLSQAIELPFHYDQYPERVSYYITYDTSNEIPFRNNFHCCGNNPDYLRFVDVGGVNVDALATEPKQFDYISGSKEAYGISIEAAMKCDALGFLCDMQDTNGLEYYNVLAKAVQHRTTYHLAQFVLDSPNLNFFTMLRREAVYGKRNAAEKKFNELTTWIAQNIPDGATDCLGCKKRIASLSVISL